MPIALLLLVASLEERPLPSVALAIEPSADVAAEDRARAQAKLLNELRHLRLEVTRTPPPASSCLADPACLEQARVSSKQALLVIVQLARVGPVTEVTVTGVGPGAVSGTLARNEDEMVQGPLLPEPVRAWLEHAAPPSGLDGDADFKRAVELYRDVSYEEAIIAFQTLAVRADIGRIDQAGVLAWIALCHAGIGDEPAMSRDMRDALARDVEVALPAKAQPSVVARFEQLRAEARLKEKLEPVLEPASSTVEAAPDKPLPMVALGLSGGAALALVGCAALGVLSGVEWAAATDESKFADERAVDHGAYQMALAGSVVAGALAAALGGAAAYFFTQSGP